jgi:hypothetical protein
MLKLIKTLIKAVELIFSNPKRFISKAQHEFVAPNYWLTSVIRRLYCKLLPNRPEPSKAKDDRILFVYDTLLNPVTFDFVHYLYYAELLRRRSGKAHIDILLVSRSNLETSREETYIAAVGDDNIIWRLSNLIVPLTRLFSSVGRIFIVDKDEAFEIVKSYRDVYPKGYSYSTPKTAIVSLDTPGLFYFPVLTISDNARKIVEAYFPKSDGRKIVTITLRTYNYITARNSDIASWVKFAGEIDPLKYRVVFIPDASRDGVETFRQINEFEIFDSACWNIELRAALYQHAWMNMGVACGPLEISGLMDKVWTVVIDRSSDYPKDYLQNLYCNGLVQGQAPNFFSKTCRFYLGKDDSETILNIFNFYTVKNTEFEFPQTFK